MKNQSLNTANLENSTSNDFYPIVKMSNWAKLGKMFNQVKNEIKSPMGVIKLFNEFDKLNAVPKANMLFISRLMTSTKSNKGNYSLHGLRITLNFINKFDVDYTEEISKSSQIKLIVKSTLKLQSNLDKLEKIEANNDKIALLEDKIAILKQALELV